MIPFNSNNSGHTSGYPLFLGAPLGVLDTINVTHPKLEELYQEQVSNMWNEFEVSLTQDRIEMMELPKETTDLMVKTIMWQTVADSAASRSISEVFSKYVSNPELSGLIKLWEFFEVIHARAYSHIIKQTFTQPNEMIQDLYNDQEVLSRSSQIFEALEEITNLPEDAALIEVKQAILKALTCFFALEAIAFMASFAVTFAITKSGVFQGIGQEVKLIARDELLHQRIGFYLLEVLKKEWPSAFAAAKKDCTDIVLSVVENELKWAEELFKEHSLVGLNADLLQKYVLHCANPVLGVYDVSPLDGAAHLKYMDEYLDSSKVQAAAQEIQLTSYKVGAVVDDTDGLEL